MDATAAARARRRERRLGRRACGELESAGELPTILVNNAAITRDTLLVRMKPEDWDAVIATNLTACSPVQGVRAPHDEGAARQDRQPHSVWA